MSKYDFIIIGGGIFGCFAAYYYATRYPNSRLAIIEKDVNLMNRASYINQARIHHGYHYPRSLSTAISSAKYFDSFCKEFEFAINKDFTKIYGIANSFSLTEPEMFEIFCNNANIPFKNVKSDIYFNSDECDNAYEVNEFSFDAGQIRSYFIDKFKDFKNLNIYINESIEDIKEIDYQFQLTTSKNNVLLTTFVLNSTYASLNKIQSLFDNNLFKLKYELCEIILCSVSKDLKNLGVTLMDGPFFSAMPFGNTNLHSLSAVEYTPHKVSGNIYPSFNCQSLSPTCKPKNLDNCNICNYKPETNFIKMYKLAKKYLSNKHDLEYVKSLYTIKTVPLESENSDSRPTLIKSSGNSNFYTVLSGKINTVFDLMGIIDGIQG